MSQFNLKSYRDIIVNAKEVGYDFISFDNIIGHRNSKSESICKIKNSQENDGISNLKKGKGRCLLRHDIDADLAAASKMAHLEAELGISATYFLMWRSPFYNLMSRSSQLYAEKILSLGHHIGLHYDQGFDAQRNMSSNGTAHQIQMQIQWLELLLDCSVHAVSFHQPSDILLQRGKLIVGIKLIPMIVKN